MQNSPINKVQVLEINLYSLSNFIRNKYLIQYKKSSKNSKSKDFKTRILIINFFEYAMQSEFIFKFADN